MPFWLSRRSASSASACSTRTRTGATCCPPGFPSCRTATGGWSTQSVSAWCSSSSPSTWLATRCATRSTCGCAAGNGERGGSVASHVQDAAAGHHGEGGQRDRDNHRQPAAVQVPLRGGQQQDQREQERLDER